MTANAANVRVAVTGAMHVDRTRTATAPTGTASALTGRDDLGYVSEDGVTLTMPGEGDTTPIRAWQNGQVVRTIRLPGEDVPQFSLTLIETKLEVIEFAFDVEVTQTATEGSFAITGGLRSPVDLVFDVVDGPELIRAHAPLATVTEITEIPFTNTDAIGYGVTIACDLDPVLGYQLKTWMTALKSA